MKAAILLSVNPKWCKLIFDGTKTAEIRKTWPTKVILPIKVYVYETQGASEMPWMAEDGHMIFRGRGQVIGEFVCHNIAPFNVPNEPPYSMRTATTLSSACLKPEEAREYLGGKMGYAWFISDAKMYDKPKELSNFMRWGGWSYFPLERPPQSWCYVEETE